MEILDNPTYFWGLIGLSVIVVGLWLYRRSHRHAAENELFDNMDDAYFESDPLLDEPSKKPTADNFSDPESDSLPPSTIDESHVKISELNPQTETDIVTEEALQEFDEDIKEAIDSEKKPAKKSRPEPELIVALFVLPNQEEGFLGTDIFTVLQDQDMSYGKMEIFHHYGVGEIKVKHPIFSVANILNPGTFNPKEMEEFRSAGLVFFMQLPGAFGGRVAFELMLNTAKRVAESLEGILTDEQQYILDQDMIEHFRDKITQYELEKEQRLSEASS
ncbi:cell division protein ZipA [Candidatus Albibeggiatoa sp. nov. NOAA]|uniref:cell division protein ZipA n=1 Tax=Candidatus Albibeggiatoa sp. nov. NOAA TaxID=3162724 RepID=UPI0032FDCD58|nr:cell division protein ZipA [Thiotrichaceae bacterium]